MRNDYELEMVSSDWINPDTGNNTGIGIAWGWTEEVATVSYTGFHTVSIYTSSNQAIHSIQVDDIKLLGPGF
jgi:hypothetical protein